MSNENHNNWKHKLEELSCLPGENIPDKNALWEKLYARIERKKSNKKAVWYWPAAACILFALTISVIIFNKKTHQVDSAFVKQKRSEIKNSVATIIDKTDSAKTKNVILSQENRMIAQNKSGKMKKEINRGKEIIKLRLPDTVNTKDLVAEAGNNFLQPIAASSNVTSMIPVKKKLKVVQINELGDPEETLPGVVLGSNQHIIQFKFANQEIYANPSVASANKDFPILRIKTSSN